MNPSLPLPFQNLETLIENDLFMTEDLFQRQGKKIQGSQGADLRSHS